ncbi:MAG: 50S ribosomal protein L4 [Planctomycetes bacterium]|nr:50S ribosomal protein L4 [Planctomycetota bacterium]
MIPIKVRSSEGTEVDVIRFPDEVLGATVRRRLLRDAVVMYEANQRRGTHDTLNRDEVAGTGAKMYRQKGTGRARHRDRVVNLWRGGYVAHGPHPRDYRQAFPRKARQTAIRSALLAKFRSGEVAVIDGLALEAPRTKAVASMLKALGLQGTVLFATEARDENLIKSARNIPGLTLSDVDSLDAWHVLRHRWLLLTRGAVDRLLVRAQGWKTKGRGSREEAVPV